MRPSALLGCWLAGWLAGCGCCCRCFELALRRRLLAAMGTFRVALLRMRIDDSTVADFIRRDAGLKHLPFLPSLAFVHVCFPSCRGSSAHDHTGCTSSTSQPSPHRKGNQVAGCALGCGHLVTTLIVRGSGRRWGRSWYGELPCLSVPAVYRRVICNS